ncbi:MAG: hypothetical protein SFU99_17035 [Saprospiraceae bacterium]|nr:hypothetical protein [Saprospiraceae bacterium]
MENSHSISRRTAVKSSVFGLLAVSVPNIVFAKNVSDFASEEIKSGELFHRYPSIDDAIVSEVVGASHFNLDRVKELVNRRPELARATWDWGFGDWETAIGAASHVGRRDIIEFLMRNGARPDIFTYAALGSYDAVKSMIEASPGVQSIVGPHGITLLQHAKIGSNSDNLSEQQKKDYTLLINYLEGLGNADIRQTNLEMTDEEKEKYLGDYRYGEGPEDGFSVKINMRKLLSLGKLGKFGGGLFRKAENVFSYNGITSVEISFLVKDGKVLSLTVHEPDLVLTAKKV